MGEVAEYGRGISVQYSMLTFKVHVITVIFLAAQDFLIG
jgi:hypothetical protein